MVGKVGIILSQYATERAEALVHQHTEYKPVTHLTRNIRSHIIIVSAIHTYLPKVGM